jgi:D-aminoacyl-tRNA deacylase
MRVVIQRCKNASVSIANKMHASIEKGLLIYLGIEDGDTDEDINWLSNKITILRIFNDNSGVMNLSVKEINGQILLISQFTLFASLKKGNRPSYIKASRPEFALIIYKKLISKIEYDLGKEISTGIFGADMQITLTNYGPVTIIIDSKNKE